MKLFRRVVVPDYPLGRVAYENGGVHLNDGVEHYPTHDGRESFVSGFNLPLLFEKEIRKRTYSYIEHADKNPAVELIRLGSERYCDVQNKADNSGQHKYQRSLASYPLHHTTQVVFLFGVFRHGVTPLLVIVLIYLFFWLWL